MPTKIISKALMGVLSAAVLAAPAYAGGNCGASNCAMPVNVMPSYTPQSSAMTVRTQNPMGHLRSVNFQSGPNVSITRVHGLAPSASIADAPTGFTNGCNPTSTTYCRKNAGRSVNVDFNAAVAPASNEPRVVAVGGGYDESKFTPRIYGDATFVPGIAHIPTSIVDRDPARAQQVLDTGRAVPQPVVVPGMGQVPQAAYRNAPAPVMQALPRMQYSLAMQSAPMMMPMRQAPMMPAQNFGQASGPVLQQSGPMAGSYGSNVGSDGTYWEKVSGPTTMGNTVATSVICKRQLPTRTVHPVIGVPVPVPVPVVCGPQGYSAQTGNQQQQQQSGRYGQSSQGRWAY